MNSLALVLTLTTLFPAAPSSLRTDRVLRVLPTFNSDAGRRTAFDRASRLLRRRKLTVVIGGATIGSADLARFAKKSNEPLLRLVREHTKRAIDLDDLLYFLDDLIGRGFKNREVVLPGDRARRNGILIHPREVFRNREHKYGDPRRRLALDPPRSQHGLTPSLDGALLGPSWAARYLQPTTEDKRLDELARRNKPFADRIRSLRSQLIAQGAIVYVEATVRPRERGYLMYGAHLLRKSKSRRQLRRRLKKIRRLNHDWGLSIPIVWRHPQGWRATREAARRMADTYGVDYATEAGARDSDHYDGAAIDIWAVGLPRRLTLKAPDGISAAFDLSAPNETRDLNLTPALVDWIDTHFRLEKLRTDYPHWGDADRPTEE